MTENLIISNILGTVVERRATDVHLVPGSYPVVRVGGRLVTLSDQAVLTPDALQKIANEVLTPGELERLDQEREVNAAYIWNNRSRFRARVFYQKGYLAVSLRLIAPFVMSPKDLNLPSALTHAITRAKGLVIITGPYGSGRTTTAASLVEMINQNHGLHILTLERPIEYLLASNQSIVEQREVGKDVPSFVRGLADVMDEDIDLILIGEAYENGVEEKILEIAESGKMVIAILDCDSAISALDRFVSNVSMDRRSWAKDILADTLQIVVAQRLLPKTAGGQVLAYEVLTSTQAVKSHIRDNTLGQLKSIIQTSADEGMRSMDKSLLELVKNGEISADVAAQYSTDPHSFKQYFR